MEACKKCLENKLNYKWEENATVLNTLDKLEIKSLKLSVESLKSRLAVIEQKYREEQEIKDKEYKNHMKEMRAIATRLDKEKNIVDVEDHDDLEMTEKLTGPICRLPSIINDY